MSDDIVLLLWEAGTRRTVCLSWLHFFERKVVRSDSLTSSSRNLTVQSRSAKLSHFLSTVTCLFLAHVLRGRAGFDLAKKRKILTMFFLRPLRRADARDCEYVTPPRWGRSSVVFCHPYCQLHITFCHIKCTVSSCVCGVCVRVCMCVLVCELVFCAYERWCHKKKEKQTQVSRLLMQGWTEMNQGKLEHFWGILVFGTEVFASFSVLLSFKAQTLFDIN